MKSLLETTLNTRELGGFMTASGKETKHFSLIRSDEVCFPNDNDIEFLHDKGITAVIDFRTLPEVERKPCGLTAERGFDYHNFSIVSGSVHSPTPEDVPLCSMEIAADPAMTEIFRTIANVHGGVLFHCKAGKDRTGTVTAILLSFAGVSDRDIIDDYVLTGVMNKERFERYISNDPNAKREVVFPTEHFMKEFLRLFREKYSDSENYLRMIGLTDSELEKLKNKLI